MNRQQTKEKYCQDCKWVWVGNTESYQYAKCSHPKASPENLVHPKNEPDVYCSNERLFGRFFGCGPKGNRWELKA